MVPKYCADHIPGSAASLTPDGQVTKVQQVAGNRGRFVGAQRQLPTRESAGQLACLLENGSKVRD